MRALLRVSLWLLKLAAGCAAFFFSMVLMSLLLQAGFVWGAALAAVCVALYGWCSWHERTLAQRYLLAVWFGLFCGCLFYWDKYGGGGQPAPAWLKALAHWHVLGGVVFVLLFLPLTLVEMAVKRRRASSSTTDDAAFVHNPADFELGAGFAEDERRR